jgi:hypothetical protein
MYAPKNMLFYMVSRSRPAGTIEKRRQGEKPVHARITRYKMKPGSIEAAKKLQASLRAEIMDLPGMRHFYNAMADDGSGYIVSLFEPGEVTPENAERVKAVWAKFSDMLEAMPVPETYEVISDWAK